MLHVYPKTIDGAAKPVEPVWFDLLSPTEAEIAEVEAKIGFPLPRQNALSEIETSSRLRQHNGVLIMSMPTATRGVMGAQGIAPLGFVLSADWLATIRFTALDSFDAVAARLDPATVVCAPEVFIELCEETIDHIADSLEHLAEELGALSVATFRVGDAKAQNATRSNRVLRAKLQQVGRLGERLSELRDGLLGLSRILTFAEQFSCLTANPETKARLMTAHQDVVSLSDYDEHLTNKVQFVLDALVGLIGIVQNDVFKVLTIVSIVGIPPTLIAGIYGMNFKNMPEYDWVFGYQYGLTIIALSAILPLIWFKVRGWF